MTKLRAAAVALEEPVRWVLSQAAAIETRMGQALARQGRVAVADLRNVPRYVLRTLIGLLVVCGLLGLWEARGDGKLPAMSPLAGLDPYCLSSTDCIAEGTAAEARWKGLGPALSILDQVNPAVAGWVRANHDRGTAVFGDDCRTKAEQSIAMAKYDRFRNQLVVNRELFCENDGTIAVTLCHEYRHSRQNFGKVCKYALSCLFRGEGDLSIIENDAVIYEQEAHAAIFGSGRSHQNELAAWERQVRLQHQSSRQ